MYVIETCPKCGADVRRSAIDVIPPIEHAECSNPDCDWSWTSKPGEIIRIPFNPYACSHIITALDSNQTILDRVNKYRKSIGLDPIEMGGK